MDEMTDLPKGKEKTMNTMYQGFQKAAGLAALFTLMLMMASGAFAQSTAPACCLAPNPVEPLTADEEKTLVFMREEEKLARDVYQILAAKWNLRIFSNIAKSEQRHFDSVGVLLERYGVKDPAAATPAGVYSDTRLAALYAELVAKGSLSLKDALEVGVLIEKTDIADLENALKTTSKLDIKNVYTNLLAGSLSHQEAFESVLEAVVVNQ